MLAVVNVREKMKPDGFCQSVRSSSCDALTTSQCGTSHELESLGAMLFGFMKLRQLEVAKSKSLLH